MSDVCSESSVSEIHMPESSLPKLSIIIPIYNEAASLVANLNCLLKTIVQQNVSRVFHDYKVSPHQKSHSHQNVSAQYIEIIVVDGGSTDDSIELLKNFEPTVIAISSESGRAAQMNAGVTIAQADTLLFLHIDTFLPENFYQAIMSTLCTAPNKVRSLSPGQQSIRRWGRFDVELSSTKAWARIVSFMINWRSRIFSIATGDQALFMTRQAFDRVGGFPQQRLMEDVEMSKRLKQYCSDPVCLREKVQTSSRRWEKHGVVRTILLMWQLRLYYYFGVSADKLYKKYYE